MEPAIQNRQHRGYWAKYSSSQCFCKDGRRGGRDGRTCRSGEGGELDSYECEQVRLGKFWLPRSCGCTLCGLLQLSTLTPRALPEQTQWIANDTLGDWQGKGLRTHSTMENLRKRPMFDVRAHTHLDPHTHTLDKHSITHTNVFWHEAGKLFWGGGGAACCYF